MSRLHWLLSARPRYVLALALSLLVPCTGAADDRPSSARSHEVQDAGDDPDEEEEDPSVKVRYEDGLHIESSDGNFAARIRWRSQMRVSDVSSSDLVGEEDGVEEETGFQIRRARLKLDGHAYRPWLRYYLEYGIAGSVMLTLQFDVQKSEKIGIRVGQYKVLYNRERVDSSGQQQFVDRSIVNRPFTLDRQQGPTVLGRLFAGSRADMRYAVGAFTGTGRGGDLEGDRRPMFIGRWQWNFLKRDLGFGQSDTRRRSEPAASLALAAASDVGRFTRFSTSGAGQLPGFEDGELEQYELTQWMVELAYHGRGLSLQAEYHEKTIDDQINVVTTDLQGWYAQAGYFLHEAFRGFPRPLELAVRVARVDTVQGIAIPADREVTFGGNWFFNDHNNKLTFDVSRLSSTLAHGSEDTGWRARFQWDVTF